MTPEALSFAATKIQPPLLRRGLLPRAALVQRIGEGLLQSRLTLISAAGGFGKSSAMAQVLAAEAETLRCAWIGCEASDTLGRLVGSLIAALEPFDLPWRQSPEAWVAVLDREDGLRAFRDALVNALAATDVPHGVIVFDDLHRVADPRFDDFLAMLPGSLPAHWGLALVTRVDPPWSLARLRAAGQLTEIRQDELRFGIDEIEALASQAGNGQSAEALLARTEGWPVGVTLAMAGARGASPVRDVRHAIDYLRSEVLDGLPSELRRFLVATSVLPELTAPRAAAVSGRADAFEGLDQIERRGLYYQEVVGRERTLRLHDIFREALAVERSRLPESQQHELWRRAAAGEPDATRRFDYLLAAQEHEAAIADLARFAPPLIASGMSDTVKAMLRKLPPELLAGSPEIAMLRGVIAWEAMDFQGLLDQMKRAASAFARRGDTAGCDLARAYVALAINGTSPIGNPQRDPAYEVEISDGTPMRTRLIASLQRAWHAFDLGDFDATHRHYADVLDQLAHEPDAALWYQTTPGMAYHGERALEPLLLRHAEGSLRVAGDDYPALRAMALSVRGSVALWQGDIRAASADHDEAASITAWINYPQTLCAYTLGGRLMCRAAEGAIEAGLAAFHDELPRIADLRGSDGRGPGWYFHWVELRCCLMAERLDSARDALRALRRTLPPSAAASHTGVLRVVDAYETWLAGDTVRAEALMRHALDYYGRHDAVGLVTALRLQLAGLCLQRGEAARAGQAMRDALDGIRRQGYAFSAGFAGPGTLDRLADSRAAAGLDDDQRATLASVLLRPAPAPAMPLAEAGVSFAGIEPVSPRELEVMAMLAAGDSNKIIARRLELSPHTVKRHVANILGKLGVESRGQAAARYRQLSS